MSQASSFTVLAVVSDKRTDASAFTASELQSTLRQALADLYLNPSMLRVVPSDDVLIVPTAQSFPSAEAEASN